MAAGIRLVDFKLEFGRLYENEREQIILADEISPDNCRLWDSKTGQKLDKDRFRQDLGKIEDAYREVAKRLGMLSQAEVDGSYVINVNEQIPASKKGSAKKVSAKAKKAPSKTVAKPKSKTPSGKAKKK